MQTRRKKLLHWVKNILPFRRENIKGKEKANRTHREVGAKVRQTIKELGGTMPEYLPVAEDIKKLKTKRKKKLKDKAD